MSETSGVEQSELPKNKPASKRKNLFRSLALAGKLVGNVVLGPGDDLAAVAASAMTGSNHEHHVITPASYSPPVGEVRDIEERPREVNSSDDPGPNEPEQAKKSFFNKFRGDSSRPNLPVQHNRPNYFPKRH